MAKNGNKIDPEKIMYGTGLIVGFSAVYFLVGIKFGMPNPFKPRGHTSKSLYEIMTGE